MIDRDNFGHKDADRSTEELYRHHITNLRNLDRWTDSTRQQLGTAQHHRICGDYDTERRLLQGLYGLKPDNYLLKLLKRLVALQTYWVVGIPDESPHHLIEGQNWLLSDHTDGYDALQRLGLVEKPRIDGEPVGIINGKQYLDVTDAGRSLVPINSYGLPENRDSHGRKRPSERHTGDLGERLVHTLMVAYTTVAERARGNQAYPYVRLDDSVFDVVTFETDEDGQFLRASETSRRQYTDPPNPNGFVIDTLWEIETRIDPEHLYNDLDTLQGPGKYIQLGDVRTFAKDEPDTHAQWAIQNSKVGLVHPRLSSLRTLLNKLQGLGAINIAPGGFDMSYRLCDYSHENLQAHLDRNSDGRVEYCETALSLHQTIKQRDASIVSLNSPGVPQWAREKTRPELHPTGQLSWTE